MKEYVPELVDSYACEAGILFKHRPDLHEYLLFYFLSHAERVNRFDNVFLSDLAIAITVEEFKGFPDW